MTTIGMEVEVKTEYDDCVVGTVADMAGDDFIVVLFDDDLGDDCASYARGTDGAWYDVDHDTPVMIRFINKLTS